MTKRFQIGRENESEKTPYVGARRFSRIACSVSGRLRSVFNLMVVTDGAELVEMGMALPLLLILVVGIIDFGRAYNTKHVMSNAAREAARMIVSTPLSDSSCPSGWQSSSPGSGTPCPVQAAAITVSNYLTNAGLSAAVCLSSTTPTYSTSLTWTYSCNGVTLVINKAYQYAAYGSTTSTITGTDVKLSYPYTFMFGRVVGLLAILGVNATGPIGQYTFTSETVMQNLSGS
jgi:Flp pilus assembly protein TadG